jgi:hypothetical protein
MFIQGKCYKCGGFLAVNNAEDAAVCPFCNQAIVVDKAVRCYLESNPQDSAAKQTPADYDPDFVAEKGVLIRYNGYMKKDVRIPAGITTIGDSAFQGMNNIETVHIPAGVKLIGAAAFSGCKMLHTVAIPEGVEVIDREVFNGCISLKQLRLPDSIKRIEAGALSGCTSLEHLNLPPQIELLPWRILEGCTALKSVTIPKQVKTIEDFAFAECSALEQVIFEDAHADSDSAAGVRRIGMNAFHNCTALTHIDIPETVEFIGNHAFRGCEKLTALRIPAHVKAIYPLAFADCTGLESVTFAGDTMLYKGSNPYKYGDNVATFYNCPKLLNISFSGLQQYFWAFPAYMESQEPVFMENGKCRHCGGEIKGITKMICSVCKNPKDY